MSIREAPISRALLDDTLPWFRALLGIAFVAYSANATIAQNGDDLRIFLGDSAVIGVFADRYWFSSLFALVLFLGEVFTSERYPAAYRLFLIPDLWYTACQMQEGLQRGFFIFFSGGQDKMADVIMAAKVTAAHPWSALFAQFTALAEDRPLQLVLLGSMAAAWIMALILGYYVARYGELLLFGKRRSFRRTKNQEK
jgi:hypothetical protein